MAKSKKIKSVSLQLLKKRFQQWYENHPDVKIQIGVHYGDVLFNNGRAVKTISIEPLWFVHNLMGDLIEWQEYPTEWTKEVENKKGKDTVC